MPYAIVAIYEDGGEEFLCEGMSDRPARFTSMAKARDMVAFMKIGMEGEVQSINVVPYPSTRKEQALDCGCVKVCVCGGLRRGAFDGC